MLVSGSYEVGGEGTFATFRIPRARRVLTMNGAQVKVIAILTGAKILCTAYATAKVDAVPTVDSAAPRVMLK